MAEIRLHTKLPEVYTYQSRDFQIFERLYDCILNDVKFDVDSTSNLTDTHLVKGNVLQLLQTKLGFFSEYKFNDECLRYTLEAFPVIIKNKGSLKSVQQAVNVFLKINHVRAKSKVYVIHQPTIIYDTQINDHTILIALNSDIKDITILLEIFKYILPTGFGFYFYFYTNLNELDEIESNEHVSLIFVSDNINQIRDNVTNYDNEVVDRLIGGVDMIELMKTPDPLAPEQSNVLVYAEVIE